MCRFHSGCCTKSAQEVQHRATVGPNCQCSGVPKLQIHIHALHALHCASILRMLKGSPNEYLHKPIIKFLTAGQTIETKTADQIVCVDLPRACVGMEVRRVTSGCPSRASRVHRLFPLAKDLQGTWRSKLGQSLYRQAPGMDTCPTCSSLAATRCKTAWIPWKEPPSRRYCARYDPSRDRSVATMSHAH